MSKKQNNNPPPVVESENSTEEKKFVNPFSPGVSYKDFIEALGDKSIQDYCGEHLGIAEIAWLEQEITHFKNKK